MPQPPQPQRQVIPGKTTTQGPLHKTPCPWCSAPQDFRLLADGDGAATGWGSQGMERGATVTCDECGRNSKVLAIEPITIVRLVAI